MSHSRLIPILHAKETKSWDAYTINHQSISSLDLMERAASAFCEWFRTQYPALNTPIIIIAGNGNNGGDGIAVARILTNSGYCVKLNTVDDTTNSTIDRSINLQKLPKNDSLTLYSLEDTFEIISSIQVQNTVLIDAIFGIGITNPPRNPWDHIIEIINLNKSKYKVISIDLPSGLPADDNCTWPCIMADTIVTFEAPKLSMLCPENKDFCPHFVLLPIGLSFSYLDKIAIDKYYVTDYYVSDNIEKRNKFAHKGDYGAVFQFCGSNEMAGAALLSTRASFKIGAGYVYIFHPDIDASTFLHHCPEVIISKTSTIPSKANVILAGCGIGLSQVSTGILQSMIHDQKIPMVLDADALNIISTNPALLDALPPHTIITPHPAEFDRLFGQHSNHLDRWQTQKEISKTKEIIVVLKGAHTCISDIEGNLYFNATGNPSLAKAGSGDVLSGIIAGLLAQGSSPLESAICGVFIHGRAADIALKTIHERSLMPSELIQFVSDALLSLSQINHQ